MYFLKSPRKGLIKYVIWVITGLYLIVLAGINACTSEPEKQEQGYLNLDPSVTYVGINTCRQCHSGIHSTFIHTGMGSSFDLATKRKSAGNFSHQKPVYDSFNNFYYFPFWQNDSFFILEYRLQGNDTIHKRLEHVKYIIGSGQHTNSHLSNENGYIRQMPLTWYAQKGTWDLPPGFEEGHNTRFSRDIGLECMTCHNALPEFDQTSENRFLNVPMGIDCERCHGPGSLHVKEKMAGNLVDTSKFIDYTIVNPKKLPPDLQMEICQRCHLQGNAVLKPGKTFFDFRPGMRLSDVMDVYLPRYKGDDERFIMASHADRFKQSLCYKNSEGKFNCISCHNPHVSVKETGLNVFNETCISCHQKTSGLNCLAPLKERNAHKDNCVGCHMPKSGTIDIPHVTVHDHYIRKPLSKKTVNGISEFLCLQAINNPNPDLYSKTMAYLQYFEKFSKNKIFLDSAFAILQTEIEFEGKADLLIYYYFLLGNYSKIQNIVDYNPKKISTEPWTSYRIGEAYYQSGNFTRAKVYFSAAFRKKPSHIDFGNKYALSLMQLNQLKEARTILEQLVLLQPKEEQTQNNLGYLMVLDGRAPQAKSFFLQAIKLNPDYVKALENIVSWEINFGEKQQAIKWINTLIHLEPKNETYKRIKEQINSK